MEIIVLVVSAAVVIAMMEWWRRYLARLRRCQNWGVYEVPANAQDLIIPSRGGTIQCDNPECPGTHPRFRLTVS